MCTDREQLWCTLIPGLHIITILANADSILLTVFFALSWGPVNNSTLALTSLPWLNNIRAFKRLTFREPNLVAVRSAQGRHNPTVHSDVELDSVEPNTHRSQTKKWVVGTCIIIICAFGSAHDEIDV